MKSCLDRDFVYVKAAEQTVERLRERFKEIRAEIEARKKETEAKVADIKPRVKARTA